MRVRLSDLQGEYRDQVERQLRPNARGVPEGANPIRPEADRMNKLEARYARHLDLQVAHGDVESYLYGSIKFRLADRTWFTPDFVLWMKSGAIEVHETKGFMRDDANVKLKVFAEMYPEFTVVLVTLDRGDWRKRHIAGRHPSSGGYRRADPTEPHACPPLTRWRMKMANQLIAQPDGRWAIWSSVVDDFVLMDATRQDVVNYLLRDSKQQIERHVDSVIGRLTKGEKPAGQFTLTFDEAMRIRNEKGGEK